MHRLILYTIVSIFLSSCCGKVDCMKDYYIKFRLINKLDSSDLVFCKNKEYKSNEIILFSKQDNKIDTINKSIFSNYGINSCDSLMIAFFYKPYEKIYIKLNSTTVDSFELRYNYYNNKCCGSYYEINTLKFNGNLVLMDSISIYNLLK